MTMSPPLADVVEQSPGIANATAKLIEPKSDLSAPEIADIKYKVSLLKESIRKNNPNLPDDAFEAIAQLYAGPWLLSQETLERGTNSLEEKELSARMQHQFVDLINHSMSSNSSDAYKKTIFFMLQQMERTAATDLGKILKCTHT